MSPLFVQISAHQTHFVDGDELKMEWLRFQSYRESRLAYLTDFYSMHAVLFTVAPYPVIPSDKKFELDWLIIDAMHSKYAEQMDEMEEKVLENLMFLI